MPTIEEIKASKFFHQEVKTHQASLDFIKKHKLRPFTIFLKPVSDDSHIELVYIDLTPSGGVKETRPDKEKKKEETSVENLDLVYLKDENFDLRLMTEDIRINRKIYIEYTPEGLVYEVLGYDGKVKRKAIPWVKLPADFPDDFQSLTQEKDRYFPILLDHVANARSIETVVRVNFVLIPLTQQASVKRPAGLNDKWKEPFFYDYLIPPLDPKESILAFQLRIEELLFVKKYRCHTMWWSGLSPEAISPNAEKKGEAKVEHELPRKEMPQGESGSDATHGPQTKIVRTQSFFRLKLEVRGNEPAKTLARYYSP